MLAHFAGDVSQDVALTGQIDAKHRAWQHLRYRALGDDLPFLWHAIKCQRARKLQPNGANRRFENPHPNHFDHRTSGGAERNLLLSPVRRDARVSGSEGQLSTGRQRFASNL